MINNIQGPSLIERIKTIRSLKELLFRTYNFGVLVLKILSGRYGEKYWAQQRAAEKITYELAKENIRDAVEHAKMGDLYYGEKDFDKALLAYMQALQYNPNCSVSIDKVIAIQHKYFSYYRTLSELVEECMFEDLNGRVLSVDDMQKSRTASAVIQSLGPSSSIEKAMELKLKGDYSGALACFEKIVFSGEMPNDAFLNNKILNEIEIAQGKTTLRSKPLSLRVTLTNKCNLHCVMCGQRKSEEWELPQQYVEEIESLMPFMERIIWVGGEAFLSPHFERLFDKASSYPHLHQCIITNGQLITEAWAEKIINSRISLCYSIDAVTKQTYELIRRGASYERLMESIELINKYKKRQSKAVTSINFVVMRLNYQEMENALDFAGRYGFNLISFSPVDNVSSDLDLSGDKDTGEISLYMENLYPRLVQKAKENGVIMEYRLPRKHLINASKVIINKDAIKVPGKIRKKELSCFMPWQSIFIGCNSITPECLCTVPLNNIAKLSLNDLWNSDYMKEYRSRILKSNTEWCDYKCTARLFNDEVRKLSKIKDNSRFR